MIELKRTRRPLSELTKKKIGDANRNQIYFNCDYCGSPSSDSPSHYKLKKKHFCNQACYSGFRANVLTKEQQNNWKGGSYEAHKRWVGKNKERMAHLKARRYARERDAEGKHTFEEWQLLKLSFNHKCANCGEPKPLTKDHIIPLALGGNDYIGNIQPLCRNCNSKKWMKVLTPQPTNP